MGDLRSGCRRRAAARHDGPRPLGQDGGQGLGRWPKREVRRARRRPAGRPGARRGRRASRRGWRRRRRRTGAGPTPAVRWSTAACTPPHGSSGVTGASLPSARATPASARSANGLQPRPRSAPSRSTYMPASPPQAASKAGWTLATMPQAAHPGDRRRRRPSPRARAGAGRRGRRPTPSSSTTAPTASSTWPTAASPMQWKPAWTPAAVQARTWSTSGAGLEAQRAGGVGPVGVGLAQRGGVRAEGAVAEQVAAGAGQPELADDVQSAALGQLAPVAEHPRAGLARRRGRAGRRGPRRWTPRGRPSRAGCRCRAPRPRRGWRAGRCRRCVGLTAP